MTDYYLRTATLDKMQASLIAAGIAVKNEDGNVVGQWDGGRIDIDWIGKIYKTVDKETVVVDSNYHANVRVSGGQLSQAQIDKLFIVVPTPTTPMRVFA
jgi:hypothetical protein